MHTFSLPFGKEKIKLELPEEQVAGVLVSHAHEYKASPMPWPTRLAARN